MKKRRPTLCKLIRLNSQLQRNGILLTEEDVEFREKSAVGIVNALPREFGFILLWVMVTLITFCLCQGAN